MEGVQRPARGGKGDGVERGIDVGHIEGPVVDPFPSQAAGWALIQPANIDVFAGGHDVDELVVGPSAPCDEN